jgi:cytochrome c-type biogenesis protein CcmH/NrfF
MWLTTAIDAHPLALGQTHKWHLYLIPLLFLVAIVLLAVSSVALSIVTLVVSDKEEDLPSIRNMPWSRTQTLLEAISWGLHAVVVLECIGMTSRQIFALVPQWRKRLSLLAKAVLPMLVSSLVYALRCTWLLVEYYSPHVSRSTWAWWIGFVWCPTLVAVAMLLYSARKQDQEEQPCDQAHQRIILYSTILPSDVFRAFSYHRLAMDFDDSLCQSPITHVYTALSDLEVGDEETLSTGSEPGSPPLQPH